LNEIEKTKENSHFNLIESTIKLIVTNYCHAYFSATEFVLITKTKTIKEDIGE